MEPTKADDPDFEDLIARFEHCSALASRNLLDTFKPPFSPPSKLLYMESNEECHQSVDMREIMSEIIHPSAPAPTAHVKGKSYLS